MAHGHGRSAPGSRGTDAGFAIASCAVLAAYNNVVGMQPWHRRWYTVVNVCATGAALSAAAASGLTGAEMGLGREELRPGLRLGSRLAAATAGGWLVIAAVPATRPVLGDERIAGVAATTAAGVLLSWLRTRSGSLAAPVLLHLAANCTGPLASCAIARTAARRQPVPAS